MNVVKWIPPYRAMKMMKMAFSSKPKPPPETCSGASTKLPTMTKATFGKIEKNTVNANEEPLPMNGKPPKVIPERKPIQIILKEDSLTEKFVKGFGKGGQKINKCNSRVQLVHESGIRVSTQRFRETDANRKEARKLMVKALDTALNGKLSKQSKKMDKIKKLKNNKARKAEKKYRSKDSSDDT